MSDETVTATAYLVVQGKRRSWAVNGKYPIDSARVTAARQSAPDKLPADAIVMKVKVQLPKRAFEPLEPEALIVVPEELVQHVVTVEAEKPEGTPPHSEPMLESD